MDVAAGSVQMADRGKSIVASKEFDDDGPDLSGERWYGL